MTDVVRLSGEDAEVALVVEAARPLVAAHAVPGWAADIVRLARERAKEPPHAPRRPVLWWVVYSLGVVAGFTGAAVMLPAKGKGREDPDTLFAIAGVAVPIAVVVLVVLALLPFPRAVRGRPESYALAACVPAVAVPAIVRTAFRFDGLAGVVGAPAVRWWLAGAAVVTVACAVLFVRAWRVRARRSVAPVYDPRSEAARLARAGARGRGVGPKWRRVVGALPASVSAPVRAQALELGPFAYVAWAYFDGGFPLPPSTAFLRG